MRWKRRMRALGPERVGELAYGLIHFIGATLRIRRVNEEKFESVAGGKILCLWHGRSMVASLRHRNRGWWVIISHSRDGDIQNEIFNRLGFHSVRGSTGRGGARALAESIRLLRAGETMAITPDGPRGPNRVVQGGVMAMAKKSGCALVPVGINASPRVLIGSWDQYMIPLPFAKATMVYGDPVYVPADANDEEVESIRRQLEDAMLQVQAEADGARLPVPANATA